MIERRGQVSSRARRRIRLGSLALLLTLASLAPRAATAAQPTAAAKVEPHRDGFKTADLGRVTAIGGAASFVGALVLLQLSQSGLARLDERLSNRDGDGRITGISYSKAQEELDMLNQQRLGAAILGTVGLVAMGFACGVLVASDGESIGWRHAPVLAPNGDGMRAGWLVRW